MKCGANQSLRLIRTWMTRDASFSWSAFKGNLLGKLWNHGSKRATGTYMTVAPLHLQYFNHRTEIIACLQSRPRNGQNRKCGRFIKILLVKSVTSPYQIRQNIVSRPFLLKSSKEVLGNHAYVFNTVKSSYHAYVFACCKIIVPCICFLIL